MSDPNQAQRDVLDATGQIIGLAADIVAGADAFRKADQKNYNPKTQDPAIPSLDDGDRDLKVQSKKGVDAVLEKIDNAPTLNKAEQKDQYQAPEQKPGYKLPPEEVQQAQVSEPGLNQKPYPTELNAALPTRVEQESAEDQAEEASVLDPSAIKDQYKAPEQKPGYKLPKEDIEQSQPQATASTPRSARAAVKNLGQSIETQLKDILKADKVETRIYSGSSLVYPPKPKTKISPEASDRLNRAFSDPKSIKGTITLSLRGEDGKLTPIYRVSKGKVLQDDYGLQKAIAQSLPEAKKVEQAPEVKTEQRVEPKVEQNVEPKVEQKVEANSIERQNGIDQSNPEQRVQRPTQDEILERQSQRIKDQQTEINSLKSQLKNAQKLAEQLSKEKVPIGLISGLKKHTNRLGDRIKNGVNTVQAQAVKTARKAGSAINTKLTDIETSTVYRASAYLAKEHGQIQADGSQQFTANHRFNINLKKDGSLTISRANEDKAVIFSGTPQRSRFLKSASLNELNQVKSLPLAVGKIRQQQAQASKSQGLNASQSQTKKASKGLKLK